MPTRVYDPPAPKKPANLSIDSELLLEAKRLKINLSQTLGQPLAEIVRAERRRWWLAENEEALKLYNGRIEREGVFSDGLRRF